MLKRKIDDDTLRFGLLVLNKVLFMKYFWKSDLTLEPSIKQKMMFSDTNRKIMCCTARKTFKTGNIEASVIQAAITKTGPDLEENLFFTPGQAHITPTQERIISKLNNVPFFSLMIQSIKTSEGVFTFRNNCKWHFRIEGDRCLHPDSLIIDAKTGKPYRIEDMYKGNRPQAIHTINPLTYELLTTSNYEVVQTSKKDVFELRTTDGWIIKASSNHRFLTEYGWKTLAELKHGDLIACAHNLPIQQGTSIPTDDARLLGYLIGDGNVTHMTPRFINTDLEIITDVSRICNKFGVSLHNGYAPYAYTLTHGLNNGTKNPIKEFVQKHGLWGRYSYNKFIPDAIFCATDDCVAEFLSALYSCDGSVSLCENGSVRIHYSTTSYELARGIALLFLRFGIRCQIKHRKGGEQVRFNTRDNYDHTSVARPSWQVVTNDMFDARRIHRIFTWVGEKKSRLDDLIASATYTNSGLASDSIPSKLAQLEVELLGWTKYPLAKEMDYKVYSDGKRQDLFRRRTIALEKLERINKVVQSPVLDNLLKRNITWQPIKSITLAECVQTYDLHVPDTHSFIADGFVVHNSGANMIGLRAAHIVGDEGAFGSNEDHKQRQMVALPDCKWLWCGVPNGVRNSPFYRIDQTIEGEDWHHHHLNTYDNPIFNNPEQRGELIKLYNGANTQGYITQVLGEWGDEAISSFPLIPRDVKRHFLCVELSDKELNVTTINYDYQLRGLLPLAHTLKYQTLVAGMDCGYSPDPSVIAIFYLEDGVWCELARVKMFKVISDYQAKLIHALNRLFDYQIASIGIDMAGYGRSIVEKLLETDKDIVSQFDYNRIILDANTQGAWQVDETADGKPITIPTKEYATALLREGLGKGYEALGGYES